MRVSGVISNAHIHTYIRIYLSIDYRSRGRRQIKRNGPDTHIYTYAYTQIDRKRKKKKRAIAPGHSLPSGRTLSLFSSLPIRSFFYFAQSGLSETRDFGRSGVQAPRRERKKKEKIIIVCKCVPRCYVVSNSRVVMQPLIRGARSRPLIFIYSFLCKLIKSVICCFFWRGNVLDNMSCILISYSTHNIDNGTYNLPATNDATSRT